MKKNCALLLATIVLNQGMRAGDPLRPNHRCCEEQPAGAYSANSIYQLDARWTNDDGASFALGQLRGRPVVLVMFYASCGYACPLLVADMARLREALPANVRPQVQFALVSFDVVRDTAASLKAYRDSRRLDAQWTLLHGDNNGVKELAALLGVNFRQEPDGSFSHSNVITILNAEGEIAHQRLGLQGPLDDSMKALVTAAARPGGAGASAQESSPAIQ
ncbi:MAG: SCO family protein [Opitutaceae bacterium]|nr:SCO family protein [Opitutaceae bacterium]